MSCVQCVKSLGAGVRFCPRCGRSVHFVRNSYGPSRATQPRSSWRSRLPSRFSGTWAGTGIQAARMGPRVGAAVFDIVVLGLLAFIANSVIPLVGPLVASWLYFAIPECSRWQGSIGKRIFSIKVVDANGVRLRFGRASGRFACRFLSSLPLGFGYALAWFNPARQTLHDFLASTRVVAR